MSVKNVIGGFLLGILLLMLVGGFVIFGLYAISGQEIEIKAQHSAHTYTLRGLGAVWAGLGLILFGLLILTCLGSSRLVKWFRRTCGYGAMIFFGTSFFFSPLKPSVFTIGLAALALGAIVYYSRPKNLGLVSFAEAGISLWLDENWDSLKTPPGSGLCSPVLLNTAGRLEVPLPAAPPAAPSMMANELRASFDANPRATADSFFQEEAVTAGGTPVLCVSFCQRARDDGDVQDMRHHHYLLTNRSGGGVQLIHTANIKTDSSSVRQAILRSLKLL